jgi:hypothetical protein
MNNVTMEGKQYKQQDNTRSNQHAENKSAENNNDTKMYNRTKPMNPYACA